MNGNIRLIGILVLAMVVLASVHVVGATGEVTWHLRKDTATGFDYPSGHVSDKIMTKDEPTSGTATWVKFDSGKESWWYTTQSAECDLTFPAGDWSVTFLTQLDTTDDKGKSLEIYLWKLSETGTATEITSVSEEVDIKGERTHSVTLAASNVDVDKGERMALSFTWAPDATKRVWIGCDSTERDSTLKSPSSSPAWPVPELSTLILFSVGLLVLAGYVALRRNNK